MTNYQHTFSVCVAALQVFGDEKLLWLVKAHVWPSPLGPWSFDIWNCKIKNIIYFIWKCKLNSWKFPIGGKSKDIYNLFFYILLKIYLQ